MAKANMVALIIALLLEAGGMTIDGYASEPTLARLTFWVQPEQMGEFAAAFDRRMLPVLTQQGLVESHKEERPTVEGAFTRQFEASSPGEVLRVRSALDHDPTWASILTDLEKVFGPIQGSLRFPERYLGVYSTPAGSGRALKVGPGRRMRPERTDPWHVISMQDRIPGTEIGPILQDRDGDLWFGTDAGLTRFDGLDYVTFTSIRPASILERSIRSLIIARR